MPKVLRKLSLIPMLGLVLAASLSSPRNAAASEACLIMYHACPPETYDCCCGLFQSCWLTPAECQSRCGD